MSLALAAPAINVLAWLHGARWLAAYGVVLALAMTAVAISLMLTIALFRTIGPKRTRLVAQIVAAVIGASFVIGVQIAAILTVGTMSRVVLFQSERIINLAPDPNSLWWLPVDAAMGDWSAVTIVFACGAIVLSGAVRFCAPRFGELAVAAGNVAAGRRSANRRALRFRPKSPGQALRAKEWVLLLRDPWLMSQSLMQLLYLLPPFFLLSRSFYGQGHSAGLVVPVAIMAAGQLAGGLAWLAISGEDAPDLIASAPVPPLSRVAGQGAGGGRRNRRRVRPAGWPSRDRRSGLCHYRRDRHRHRQRVGDGDPVLVSRPGQAQPVSPASRLVAHRHLRRGALFDNLG